MDAKTCEVCGGRRWVAVKFLGLGNVNVCCLECNADGSVEDLADTVVAAVTASGKNERFSLS